MFSVFCGLACLHYNLRSTALDVPYFHNEDTAGITYSADLIRRGGLPLIDTVEMKAPGSFYLLSAWWSMVGRSLYSAQLLMIFWSLLAALGVGYGAWLLYRSRGAAIAGCALYIYLSPFTDSIDINYGAWMITPYIWAACLLWRGLNIDETQMSAGPLNDDDDRLQRIITWSIAGSLIAVSALMKRQGAAIFPLAIWIIYRHHRQRQIAMYALFCGLGMSFALFFMPYLLEGELWGAMKSYFFSKSGWSYLASDLVVTPLKSPEITERAARLPRLWDGFTGWPHHLPLASGLALSAQLSLAWGVTWKPTALNQKNQKLGEERRQGRARYLWILLGLSFCGAALGLRFFKGYYLQLLPALLWLAVDPKGWTHLFVGLGELKNQLIERWKQRRIRDLLGIRMTMMLLLICLTGVTLYSGVPSSWRHFQRARKMRSGPLYLPALQIKEISQYVVSKSEASPTLWVWGRWAWPAYYYTEGSSSTRYFKNLGVLTTQLSNTWNPKRRSEPTRFNPRSPWREAIKELKESHPQWIIIARNESMRRFKALRALLNTRYKRLSYGEMNIKATPKRRLFEVYQLSKGD